MKLDLGTSRHAPARPSFFGRAGVPARLGPSRPGCADVRRWAWLIAFLALLAATPVSAAQTGAACRFQLGFATLHDALPSIVGDCLDGEMYASNGDSLQHTTGGLLAWRKA